MAADDSTVLPQPESQGPAAILGIKRKRSNDHISPQNANGDDPVLQEGAQLSTSVGRHDHLQDVYEILRQYVSFRGMSQMRHCAARPN